MTRLMPDPLEDDNDSIRQWVSEAGEPWVVPRPEYVAELNAMILDNLAPPRPDWAWSARLVVASGLAAACLLAVLVWSRRDLGNPVSNSLKGGTVAVKSRPATTDEPSVNTSWLNVRRTLDPSALPQFSWPIQESSPLSVMTSIPPDLLD